MKTAAYGAQSARSPLLPYTIERRDPGPRDVALEIVYCGVCHSDLHAARGEWDGVPYPCVPGHEIVGRVTHVGSAVKRVAPGSMVAVGCMVDSCRVCDACKAGLGAVLRWTARLHPDIQRLGEGRAKIPTAVIPHPLW